jgi:hypothetical protein
MLEYRSQPTWGLYKKLIYVRVISYMNYLHSSGIPHCSELTYSWESLSVTATGHSQLLTPDWETVKVPANIYNYEK